VFVLLVSNRAVASYLLLHQNSEKWNWKAFLWCQ